MKKSIGLFCALFLFSTGALSQENTFPSTGNVGIGIASPGVRLQVNGNVKIDSTLIVQDSAVFQQRMRIMGELVVDGFTKFKDDVKVLGDVRAKSNLRVELDARVDGQLRVDGITKLNGIVKMTGLDGYSGDFADAEMLVTTSTGRVYRASLGTLGDLMYEPLLCGGAGALLPRWFNGVNKLFTHCDSVQVGIGTANPGYKLDVRGTTYSQRVKIGTLSSLAPSDEILNVWVSGSARKIASFGKFTGGVAVEYVSIENDGSLIMNYLGSNNAMTINNGSGHALVINSSTGNKILQIENDGLLRSRKIRLNTDAWADYVFKPGYKLSTLEETERFIAVNGHLPGVPSEEEVVKDGIDVGEMQKTQMEKIEELFLHVIEMDKKIQSLEKQVDELEEENKKLKGNK